MRTITTTIIIAVLLLTIDIACDAQNTFEDVQDTFIALNNTRTLHGLKPLTYYFQKQNLCDDWAYRIAGSLNHNYSDNYLGEAISECPVSTELIIPLFMDSESHKDILMDRKARRVCMGIYYVPEKTVVTGSTIEFTPPIYYTVIRTYN